MGMVRGRQRERRRGGLILGTYINVDYSGEVGGVEDGGDCKDGRGAVAGKDSGSGADSGVGEDGRGEENGQHKNR